MASSRQEFGRIVTGRLDANALFIDYRSFGDSDKVTPSEEGLNLDARAAWDWLLSKGVRPENIVLVGVSLGRTLRIA
jgi:abhydrolase domain-containing protein 12